MVQIEFKECCKKCDCIAVDVETETFKNAFGVRYVNAKIGCMHQLVCKEYREEPEEKRLVKS